jgi:polysaccharide export outer membrane protein
MRSFLRSALGGSLLALATCLAGALAGCGGGSHSIRQTKRVEPQEYRLGAEDVVEILVFHEPEFSRVEPVRPDGMITVPQLGDVKAAGKTARELEPIIAEALAKRITAPMVTVTVKEVNAPRVYILGEVARPGTYQLRGVMSVLQGLALAGGLTEFADGDDITVLRQTSAGKEERLRFNYGAAVRGDMFDLQAGDTVIVP